MGRPPAAATGTADDASEFRSHGCRLRSAPARGWGQPPRNKRSGGCTAGCPVGGALHASARASKERGARGAGGGGPSQGVTPQFTDPRLRAPSVPVPVRSKTSTERLDSAIASQVHHLQDSLAALGPQRTPGDWTWKGKDGKKYGIDGGLIHLGNFSIPTALLALLPFNVQGNPTTYENARRIGSIRAEIIAQEARSVRDEEFNQAVKELRERKQKERADKAKADQTLPEAPPPVKIVP